MYSNVCEINTVHYQGGSFYLHILTNTNHIHHNMLTTVKTNRNICTVFKKCIPLQRKTEMTPFEANKMRK